MLVSSTSKRAAKPNREKDSPPPIFWSGDALLERGVFSCFILLPHFIDIVLWNLTIELSDDVKRRPLQALVVCYSCRFGASNKGEGKSSFVFSEVFLSYPEIEGRRNALLGDILILRDTYSYSITPTGELNSLSSIRLPSVSFRVRSSCHPAIR